MNLSIIKSQNKIKISFSDSLKQKKLIDKTLKSKYFADFNECVDFAKNVPGADKDALFKVLVDCKDIDSISRFINEVNGTNQNILVDKLIQDKDIDTMKKCFHILSGNSQNKVLEYIADNEVLKNKINIIKSSKFANLDKTNAVNFIKNAFRNENFEKVLDFVNDLIDNKVVLNIDLYNACINSTISMVNNNYDFSKLISLYSNANVVLDKKNFKNKLINFDSTYARSVFIKKYGYNDEDTKDIIKLIFKETGYYNCEDYARYLRGGNCKDSEHKEFLNKLFAKVINKYNFTSFLHLASNYGNFEVIEDYFLKNASNKYKIDYCKNVDGVNINKFTNFFIETQSLEACDELARSVKKCDMNKLRERLLNFKYTEFMFGLAKSLYAYNAIVNSHNRSKLESFEKRGHIDFGKYKEYSMDIRVSCCIPDVSIDNAYEYDKWTDRFSTGYMDNSIINKYKLDDLDYWYKKANPYASLEDIEYEFLKSVLANKVSAKLDKYIIDNNSVEYAYMCLRDIPYVKRDTYTFIVINSRDPKYSYLTLKDCKVGWQKLLAENIEKSNDVEFLYDTYVNLECGNNFAFRNKFIEVVKKTKNIDYILKFAKNIDSSFVSECEDIILGSGDYQSIYQAALICTRQENAFKRKIFESGYVPQCLDLFFKTNCSKRDIAYIGKLVYESGNLELCEAFINRLLQIKTCEEDVYEFKEISLLLLKNDEEKYTKLFEDNGITVNRFFTLKDILRKNKNKSKEK